MWETLRVKVEHGAGTKSSDGSEDQSAHSLEEGTRDSNKVMSGLVSDAHDPSGDLELTEEDHGVQFIGSTFENFVNR